MGAARYDFEIEQGSSFRIIFSYKNNSGNAVDITDWCGRLIWKTNTNISQIFTTDNTDFNQYKFTIEGPYGRLILELPASITNTFEFTLAKYDLEIQSPDDHYYTGSGGGKFTVRILYGTITIDKRYSKSKSALECNE